MNSYFHFAPILLAPGSVIEPGNFGRLIGIQGEAHPLFRREMLYEEIRRKHFSYCPSRLNCVFCFLTLDEAQLCRNHIRGYDGSILYEVENFEDEPHVADMNSIQHYGLSAFDINSINYYWQGWKPSPDPKAVVLREVLLRHSVTIVRKI